MTRSYWQIGYYQKSAYQRNLLTGAALVYGPLLIFTFLWILLLNPAPSFRYSAPPATGSPVSEQVKTPERSGTRWIAKSGIEGARRSIRIVSETQSNDLPAYAGFKPVAVEVGSLPPEGNLDSGPAEVPGKNAAAGFGLGDIGPGYDVGLPRSGPYLPWPHGVEKTPIYFDRAAEVMLASPSWPSEGRRGDTGVVVLLLEIDKHGYISWDILKVDPPGFGFRRVVEAALLEGKYYPAEADGHRVKTTVMLTVYICRECEPEVSSSRNNVKVSLLNRSDGG